MSIHVPADSFCLADQPARPVAWAGEAAADFVQRVDLPANYFRMVLPREEMRQEKAALFNYGLKDLPAVLNQKLPQLSSQQRTIPAKASAFMYVIILANRGTEGTLRTGFRVRDNTLYYRVNGEEIACGPAPIKHLKRVLTIVGPDRRGTF